MVGMDILAAPALGLGLWAADITWYFIRGKAEGHDFKYYLGRGALKAVVGTVLFGTYLLIRY